MKHKSFKHRPKEHQDVQRAGRERDYNTCQICGSTTNVEGHHVMDYAMGGAADIDNIIALCHDCHNKVHHGLIDIDIF